MCKEKGECGAVRVEQQPPRTANRAERVFATARGSEIVGLEGHRWCKGCGMP